MKKPKNIKKLIKGTTKQIYEHVGNRHEINRPAIVQEKKVQK